ncbi:MAG: response regulator, partial [Thaumarchaeota archaeon]|nr:response regulator [Nitrososphaerota archaeon]
MNNLNIDDILIIEDAIPLSIILGEYLKKLGYQKIHHCKNGTLGIQKFQELSKSNNVPVVFLDYYLPDISAQQVLKQILEIYPSTDVIIETVANESESGIKRLFELGARSYFPK